MRAMHIEKHVVLAAAPAEAWAVVVDFASWFCHAADMSAIKPGARIQFSWEDGTTRAAVFEDVDVPRFPAFRWLPFARDEHGDPIPRPQARVEITLTRGARCTSSNAGWTGLSQGRSHERREDRRGVLSAR